MKRGLLGAPRPLGIGPLVKGQGRAAIQRTLREFNSRLQTIAKQVTNVRTLQGNTHGSFNFILDFEEERDIPSGVVINLPEGNVTDGRHRFPTIRQVFYDRDIEQMWLDVARQADDPPLPVFAQRGDTIGNHVAGPEPEGPEGRGEKIIFEVVSSGDMAIDPHVQFLVEELDQDAYFEYSRELMATYSDVFGKE